MEFTACNPETGTCRVIVREEWPASWTDNRPFIQYLKDQKRFIWGSERTGFRNYYLYDMTGKLINPITTLSAEVVGVVKVDEATNTMWYVTAIWSPKTKVSFVIATNKMEPKLDGSLEQIILRNKK